jgi:hypothetical protein
MPIVKKITIVKPIHYTRKNKPDEGIMSFDPCNFPLKI